MDRNQQTFDFKPPNKPSPGGINAVLYFDGSCEPNPGLMRAAFVLKIHGDVVEGSRCLGEGTSNIAEYQALIDGLQKAADLGATDIEIRGDSRLVIDGINAGPRKKGMPHMKALKLQALAILNRKFRSWAAVWIPREQNSHADSLSQARFDAIASV